MSMRECCRPDPEFPVWECPTCGSIYWSPEIEYQADFDRDRFLMLIREKSLQRLQSGKDGGR